MKTWTLMICALFSTIAAAATTTLEPGDGRQYLENWCGGQKVTEVAEGFTDAGNALAAVKVTTTCSTGGRGAKPRTFLACWLVTFDDAGAILDQEFVNKDSWLQGHPARTCAVAMDAAAVYTRADGSVLSTVGKRAVLTTPADGPGYAWTDPGTVEAAGGTETSFDLTFTNNGDAPLHVYSGDAYMTSAGGSIQATALTCWQADLAVGDSCTLTLRFVDYEDHPSGGDLFGISVALYTDAPYEELPVMIHTNWP